MNYRTLPTYQAFLARIREAPPDNGPREVLADWLDELELLDAAAEALYIRDSLADPLRVTLFADVARVAVRIGNDVGRVRIAGDTPNVDFEVSRGFVSGVRLRIDRLMGQSCYCRREIRISEFREPAEPCRRCEGRGFRPVGLIEALFATHPIERVVLTNITPMRFPAAGLVWYVPTSRQINGAHAFAIIPDALHDELTGWSGHRTLGKSYPTVAAAEQALSNAVVDLGRRLVGLNAIRRNHLTVATGPLVFHHAEPTYPLTETRTDFSGPFPRTQ